MEKAKLEEVIGKLNIRDNYAANLIRKNTADLDFSVIDEGKFDTWFLSRIEYLMSGRYRASLFLSSFKDEFYKGTFKKDPETKKQIQPGVKQATDLFEVGVDAWIEEVHDLCGEYPEAAAYDDNGFLRGYFDGKGGFYYTDGTVSKKWPCRKERIKSEPSIAPDAEQKILEALNSKTSGEENPV